MDTFALIVGTGFSGLGMAIQLRRAGIEDFIVLEKEHDVGGTWLVNDYPGCACDVQSHLYSFSFEPNPEWTREFSGQPEILAYLRRCADKYRIRDKTQFGAYVVGASYDDAADVWRVRVADANAVKELMRRRGLPPGTQPSPDDPEFPPVRVLTARVLVSGTGGLSTPAYPQLRGLERFRGKAFHSQRWEHDYDLTGKRVAVIGTGASAIQFVPAIQPKVAHLDVYQRTPPWVLPKPDRAITDRERWWFRNVPVTRLLRRFGIYCTLESRAVAFVVNPKLAKQAEELGIRFLKKRVKDPVLREKLTPRYAIGCKRVLMSWDWYPALTQPNVDVVTAGIREVREHSIVGEDGVERPVDAIIFGTGFRVADPIPRGVFFGRGGVDLLDTWPEGPEAYKGTTVAGFPNLFLLVGPNTGLGHTSLVYMIESQIRYVLDAIRFMRRHDVASVEVRKAAQSRFNERVQKRSKKTVWVSGGCKSYYLNAENGRNVAVWPDFTFRFRSLTRRFDVVNYVVRTANARRHIAAEIAAPRGAPQQPAVTNSNPAAAVQVPAE